ncbi:MAG: zinc-binding dehydrogenase [Spirochaetales bacterium]|nr:zinc-binding dehydrogenase [Spirochaetales bacterium]
MSEIWDNEILVNVEILNVDSASFTQIKEACGGDEGKIKEMVLSIVAERGKMQNPVTGSGGMFIGTVAEVGDKIKERGDLKPGDKIASLVSLSLTPLRIDDILEVRKDIDQVRIKGQAVLFASGIYAKLPNDMPDALALAVLDVCGAPAQVARLVRPGDTVAIIGASGKSGILCAWEAKKRAGISGKVIGFASSERGFAKLKKVNLCDENRIIDATDALACNKAVSDLTGGKMADVVINCVNIENTEMGSILMSRQGGTIYFFSMATSFTRAALGAEGVGMDVNMIIGNGYAKDHADITLNILRESPVIRKLYEELYA